MMANANNSPTLRFPEFTEDWFDQSLDDLFTFKNGINASKEAYGKGYKFINVLDIIQNDYITHDDIIGSVDISPEDFEKYDVEYGDILFQRSSETREEVGQTNVYLDEERSATFGGFVIRGKKKGEYEPYFINSLLKTSIARKEITSKSGGSTRYNIGQEALKEVVITTTQLPEQEKIATFLAAVDKSIRLLEAKRDALVEYKRGVMQRIFDRELRFRDEDGEAFPEWALTSIGDIGNLFSGGTPSSRKKEYYTGTIPFIRSAEIDNDKTELYLSEEGLKKSSAKMVEVGDLLMAIYGANSGEVALSKIDGAINQAIICIRGGFSNSFLKSWLEHYQNNITSKYLQGGQGNLSGAIVKSIRIDLPSLLEQEKIAAFISKLDSQLRIFSDLIDDRSTFKQGLLQQLFI